MVPYEQIADYLRDYLNKNISLTKQSWDRAAIVIFKSAMFFFKKMTPVQLL